MVSMTKPLVFSLEASKYIPNSKYPLLLYKSAFADSSSSSAIESYFRQNGWDPQWQFPMYKQAHYHSTTHEALGIFRGSGTLHFGACEKEDQANPVENQKSNQNSTKLDVKPGDLLVIPAGVSHRSIGDRDGFCMVGAYPSGSPQWDMNYDSKHPTEDRETFSQMAVPPELMGSENGIHKHWKL